MGPVNQRVQVLESLLRSPTKCGWSSTGDRLSAGKPVGRGRLPGCPCLRPAGSTLRSTAAGQNHPKRIHCESTHLFPIKELIEGLDSEVFWQIQRGTVVNLRVIADVICETNGRPRIRLRNCPEILAVSRS